MINCSKEITKAKGILAILRYHLKGKSTSVLKSWEVYLNISFKIQKLGYCLILLQDWEQFINVIVGPGKHVDLSFSLIIYWGAWCIFLSLLDIAVFFFFLDNKAIYTQSGREKCPRRLKHTDLSFVHWGCVGYWF